jgi:hypothetical protein
MAADAPAVDTGSAPIKRRKRPRKALDMRTRNGRRVKALTAAYTEALGSNLSPVQQAAVARAAFLTTIAEDLALQRLRGEPVDIDSLVRADSTARRATRDIGLRPPQELEAAKTFREFMRAKYGEDDE